MAFLPFDVLLRRHIERHHPLGRARQISDDETLKRPHKRALPHLVAIYGLYVYISTLMRP